MQTSYDTTQTDAVVRQFEDIRRIFPHTQNLTYFNSASYGPFATTVKSVIDENVDLRLAANKDDTHDTFETAEIVRQDIAGLIGARKEEIGIGLSTTFGLNIAAYGLPLKRGDEILVSDIEFPAAVYAFRGAAEARGLKLRFIKSRDRRFDVDLFRKAIHKRSKVLVISFVQFFNGYKNDLEAISRICKEHGLYFVVDGIQGMGTQPINVRDLGIDVFACGCQKWMLAPQGSGFFYISDEVRDKIVPPFTSWLSADWGVKFTDLFYFDKPYFESARKFEMGYYAVLNILGLKPAVEIFKQLGIANIQTHNNALIDRLVDYLNTNRFYTITSSLEPQHRSSIFTFSCLDVPTLHRRILDNKVILVQREGSIRVSAHLFNNFADVDRLISVLDEFAREERA